MDDDRFIIDLRDLELGFSVWQVCMCVHHSQQHQEYIRAQYLEPF